MFYALFGLGLVVFAVSPPGLAPGWGKTVDMAWGTCVSAAAAAGGKSLMDWAAPV